METFETAWRRARLLLPGVPALVVRDWVQETYARLCERKPWSWLRAEGILSTQDARAVSVTATQGSTTLTSVGLFVPGDLGRQFRGAVTGSGLPSTVPLYTIVAFTDVNTVVLDQAWAAPSGAVDGQILDALAVLPADFGAFLGIINPYDERTVTWWANLDTLLRIDPARTVTDSSPLALIAARPSPVPATLGQPTFAWYPLLTVARQFPYLYQRRPVALADETVLPGPLADRPDVLRLGAQASAAEWPGTVDLPNPYFNLTLADRLHSRWESEVNRLMLRDDDLSPEQYLQYTGGSPGLTNTASRLRQTDALAADYL